MMINKCNLNKVLYITVLFYCTFISPFGASNTGYLIGGEKVINKSFEENDKKLSRLSGIDQSGNQKHISWALTILTAILGKKRNDIAVVVPKEEDEKKTSIIGFLDKKTKFIYFMEDVNGGFEFFKLPELPEVKQQPYREERKENFLVNACHCTYSDSLGTENKKNRFVDLKDGACFVSEVQYALIGTHSGLSPDEALFAKKKKVFISENISELREVGQTFNVTRLVSRRAGYSGQKKRYFGSRHCALGKDLKVLDIKVNESKNNIVTKTLKNWSGTGRKKFDP